MHGSLERAKALNGTNGVSERELEQAISDQQTAEGALRAARYAVKKLNIEAYPNPTPVILEITAQAPGLPQRRWSAITPAPSRSGSMRHREST